MNYWVAIIPLAVGFLWFVWNVFWQPYKTYVAQHNGFQMQLKEKESEISTLKTALENLTTKKGQEEKLGECLLQFKNHLDTVRNTLNPYGHPTWDTRAISEQSNILLNKYFTKGDTCHSRLYSVEPKCSYHHTNRGWEIERIVAIMELLEQMIREVN